MNGAKRVPRKAANPVARMVLTLLLITSVCAFILAYVNENTSGIIKAREQKKLDDSMKEVMADADSFELTDFAPGKPVSAFYLAKAQGKLAGYCVSVAPNGFGGAVKLMVGVDLQGKVGKIMIVGMSETPGLGTKAKNPDFLAQYEGKSAGIEVNGKSDNHIDAITGATVTSRAVTSGVNAALSAVADYQAKGGGQS